MKIYRAGQSTDPFPLSMPSDDRQKSPDQTDDNQSRQLPEGWVQLPTGLRGARLYRFLSPGGGDPYWQAEMTLNGQVQCRRCASELYARWWLSALNEPHDDPRMPEWEERHVPSPSRGIFARRE